MVNAVWKNTVLEMQPDKRGCYVSMWTGYRWEFWAGPFESEREAEVAVAEWKHEYCPTGRVQFQFENLDGEK